MCNDKVLGKAKKTLVKDIRLLLIGLKPEIADDYRCTDRCTDETPGMCVTIGARINDDNEVEWSYQTGDNSFTGCAYGYRHWSVIYLARRSNSAELAKDAANELIDEIAQAGAE